MENQPQKPESKAEIAYQFGLGLGKGIGKFMLAIVGILVLLIVLAVPFFAVKPSETVSEEPVIIENQ